MVLQTFGFFITKNNNNDFSKKYLAILQLRFRAHVDDLKVEQGHVSFYGGKLYKKGVAPSTNAALI